MPESLMILSDRDVLTRTLLEINLLLREQQGMTFQLLSYRARVRVHFLLLHLCQSCLSANQVTSIRQVSRTLEAALNYDQHVAPESDLLCAPSSIYQEG